MSEEFETRVLFLSWSQIATWATNTCLVLSSFPRLRLESKAPFFLFLSLYLSLSLLLSFSISLLPYSPYESCCPKISWDDPWENISTWEQPKSIPNIFPPFSDPPSKIHLVVQKSSSVGVETFQLGPSSHQSSHCHPFMVTSWPPHVDCGLHESQIWHRYQNIFKNIYKWALPTSGFLQQITLAWSGFVESLGR